MPDRPKKSAHRPGDEGRGRRPGRNRSPRVPRSPELEAKPRAKAEGPDAKRFGAERLDARSSSPRTFDSAETGSPEPRSPEPVSPEPVELDQEDDRGARWMEAFQAGDSAAFENIVTEYQLSVYHFIFRMISDHGRTEDLTQEVFLRVYNARDRYQVSAKFRTWLFTIANRLGLNELRARRRRARVFVQSPPSVGEGGSGEFFASVPARDGEPPAARVERQELESLLETLMAQLPPNQRAAIQLHRAELFSYQEISEVIGVTAAAVKSLLVRARQSLKTGIQQHLQGQNRFGAEP